MVRLPSAAELFPTLANGWVFLLYRGLNLSLLRGRARLRDPGKSIPGMRFIFDWIFTLIGFRKRLRRERFSYGACEFRHLSPHFGMRIRRKAARFLKRSASTMLMMREIGMPFTCSNRPAGDASEGPRQGVAETALTEEPKAQGHRDPDETCDRNDQPGAVPGKSAPNDQRKGGQSDAPERRTCRIDARRGAPAIGSIVADAPLVLPLVLFDETRGRRKDSGKGEEEAANLRTEALGEDAGRHGADASEEEAQCKFVEFDPFERCEFCGDDHVNPIRSALT